MSSGSFFGCKPCCGQGGDRQEVADGEAPAKADANNDSLGGAMVCNLLRVAVGDMVPNMCLDYGFPPKKVSLPDRCKGKKVVLVGLPGAFTPT